MSIEKYESDDIHEVAIEAKDQSKRNLFLWYTYDATDNFFSQTIISLAFTPYAMILGHMMEFTIIETYIYVSLFMAGSNLLVAIFGPVLGAISDTAGKRKPAVIAVATIFILSTALTASFVNFWWAAIMFVIGNFCYQAGRMFYDAQIPFITKPEGRSVAQAVGGALAPIGSFLGIGAGLIAGMLWGKHTTVSSIPWELNTDLGDIPLHYDDLRWLFLLGAGILIVMMIPYLFHKEQENPTDIPIKENVKESLVNVRRSIKTIFTDRNSIFFFLAWFFIVDAANTTILFMVPVIEGAVGITDSTLTYIIIGVGILLSTIFGIITGLVLKRLGPKLVFLISGIGWVLAVTFFIFAGWQYKTEFIPGVPYVSPDVTIIHTIPWWLAFFGAFFIGIGFGSIWIVGRQFIMVLAPPSKLAQYAGFQKIAGRVSAIVSPLIFAGMMFAGRGWGTHHAYRLALLSIIIFFIIGLGFTALIKDPYKRYQTGERAPYPGIYDKKEKAAK